MALNKYEERVVPQTNQNLLALLIKKPEGWEKSWRWAQERAAIDAMFDAWEQMNRILPPDKVKRMWAGVAKATNRAKGRPPKTDLSSKDVALIKDWIRVARLVRNGDPGAPSDILSYLQSAHKIQSKDAAAKRLSRAKEMLRPFMPKT